MHRVALMLLLGCSCSRRSAYDAEVRPVPAESASSATTDASEVGPPEDVSVDDEEDPAVDMISDGECRSGDPKTLGTRVRITLEPSTNLSLEEVRIGMGPEIAGEVAVSITNLTDETICVRHYDSFSVRFLERLTGRREYLSHFCQCLSLAKGFPGTKLVLAPHQTRRWHKDSMHFSCTGVRMPPGDYDVSFAIFPGEHRVPPPYLDPEVDHHAKLEKHCETLMRSTTFWSSAVSSAPLHVILSRPK